MNNLQRRGICQHFEKLIDNSPFVYKVVVIIHCPHHPQKHGHYQRLLALLPLSFLETLTIYLYGILGYLILFFWNGCKPHFRLNSLKGGQTNHNFIMVFRDYLSLVCGDLILYFLHSVCMHSHILIRDLGKLLDKTL